MMRSPESGRLGVSVVVPAFNEEAVLSECLSALIGQTIPVDEILVKQYRPRQVFRRFDPVSCLDSHPNQDRAFGCPGGVSHEYMVILTSTPAALMLVLELPRLGGPR
jgi:cellulose synthase/poly-beta-1,6-N-acetylglucosamine synthase-like glycosyltransferase